MREPTQCDYDRAGYIVSLSQARAAHVLAEYRAHDEAPLRARIKELEAEVATPVLVATNRLADSLADARAENERLREALGGSLNLMGEMMSYDRFKGYPHNLVQRVEAFMAPFDAKGIDAALAPAAPEEPKP